MSQLTVRHRYAVQFTFPVAISRDVETVCLDVAGGISKSAPEEGIWLDADGSTVRDEVQRAIVSVTDDATIYLLLQEVAQILADYGEQAMWFAVVEMQGGVLDIRGVVNLSLVLGKALDRHEGSLDGLANDYSQDSVVSEVEDA